MAYQTGRALQGRKGDPNVGVISRFNGLSNRPSAAAGQQQGGKDVCCVVSMAYQTGRALQATRLIRGFVELKFQWPIKPAERYSPLGKCKEFLFISVSMAYQTGRALQGKKPCKT